MKLLGLALLLLASAARAEVREIKSMAEIVPAVDTGTLLVFDIDNTLLEPVGNIGSDQWYYYIVKAGSRDGLSGKDADAAADKAWRRAMETVKYKPVESLTPALARAQVERGVAVMALTARGPEDEADTLRQLKDAGFGPAVFSAGVTLMGDGDKGKFLLSFLKKTGRKPARVVFVDDKIKNVKNMDAALTAAGVPIIAFRYGATDEKVAAFNGVMAEAADKASAELLFHGRVTK